MIYREVEPSENTTINTSESIPFSLNHNSSSNNNEHKLLRLYHLRILVILEYYLKVIRKYTTSNI